MSVHNIAFWTCAFFLLGIFSASFLAINPLLIFGSILLISLYFIVFKKYLWGLLILFIAAGFFYYQIFDKLQNRVNIPFEVKSELKGIIKRLDQTATKQEAVLELMPPYKGAIKINAKRYPDLSYGDLIIAKGTIEKPPDFLKNYYAKDGIFGLISFPEIKVLESGHGNSVKAALFSFKNRIKGIFGAILPTEKSAFLSGLTLGEKENFSKEFKEKMSLSGTSHLVALSGYNISIIAVAISAIFGSYLPAAVSFYLTISVIALFVLMTGAEASVVRAAVMGIILILAGRLGREYSLRNAIVITAFLMALFNPKILVFDLGFQLSFAALLGIVYISPVFGKIFRAKKNDIFSFKENAAITLSAQLAVIPLLLNTFGYFSLMAPIANLFILPAIPLVMGLGFLAAGLGFLSVFLAKIMGLIINPFLSYILWLIDLFSKTAFVFNIEKLNLALASIYYILLVVLIIYINGKFK